MKIFYFCYDHDRPTGGQKHTYQHVDILNRLGYQAFVVHYASGFRLSWFRNRTAVIHLRHFAQIHDPTRDVVVLPEDLGALICDFPGRKVIFNKNVYHGLRAAAGAPLRRDPGLDRSVVAMMTVSQHNARLLRFTYPELTVVRVSCGIDTNVFQHKPLSLKRRQIAYLDKGRGDLGRVLVHLLRSRAARGLNALGEYSFVPITSKTEQQVARILRESLLLLFCSVEEGFARLPVEAMACGCLPLCFGRGTPMGAYLPLELSFPQGDLIGLANRVEAIASDFPDGLARWQGVTQECLRRVARYSMERQTQSVRRAWRKILKADGP